MRNLAFLSLFFSTLLFAQDIEVIGTITKPLKIPKSALLCGKVTYQNIKLLKIKLSQQAKQTIINRANTATKKISSMSLSQKFPHRVELGMNDVPVLDQGNFSTCVMFANTAAIDAALGKGDYISQLCQLQLGIYLEQNGYAPSGWEGSSGKTVLSQIEQFGIVSKENQRTLGCGGVTDYPKSFEAIPSTVMPLEQFHEMSEDIGNYENANPIVWANILDMNQAILTRVDTNKTIDEIKNALNAKDRVTFGTLLLDFHLGVMGAVGSYRSNFDTWVLTTEITRDLYLSSELGGHEMIITGYDDNAIAIDEEGREHKGLFTLRNSWGEKVGDKGNFYMSYDYFKVLVIEAQRIMRVFSDEV